MPIEVEGPDGVIVEFPEGTDNATIERAMSQKFPKPSAAAPALAPSAPTANAPIVSEFTPFRLPTGQVLTKQEDYDSLPDNIKQGLVTAATKDPHDWANTSFGEGWDRSLKKQGGWGLSENTRQWLGARQKDSIIPSFLSPIVDAPADIADLGFRGLQAAQAGAESGAELLDAASISTGVADALSWGGNKFLPGSGLMALAEAFPFGLEPGLATPRLRNKVDAEDPLSPEGLTGTVTDEAPAPKRLSFEDEAAFMQLQRTGTAEEITAFLSDKGLPGTPASIEAFVTARDKGLPVTEGLAYTDPLGSEVGNKLGAEATAFSQRQRTAEPTVERVFPTEEQKAAQLKETEARLQQEAVDFQARKAVPEAEATFTDPAIAAKAIEDTRVEIAGHMSGWKNAPDYHVVNTLDELSEADRALMSPTAAAAVMPDGRVVFNKENIRSPEHLKAAVFHEMLGHHGLTQRFGAVLDNTIEKIIDNSPDFKSRVDEWLEANPNTYADAPDRVIRAGDEVLAQMSEAGVIPLTVMNRIRNAVKEFLRAAGMKNLDYSQREIETILALSHDAVINGKPRDVAGNGFKLPARFMYVGDKAAKSKADADGVLELNEDPHAERRVTAEKLFNEGADPEVIREITGWHIGPEGGWRREIDDSGATFRSNYFDFKAGEIPSMKLSEFIDHPELFDLYPQLKDIEIVGYKGDSNSLGWAKPNKIGINTTTDADIMETLVHEIQHQVQDIEGWASGGNPLSALKSMTDKQYADFIDKKASEIESNLDRHTERKDIFEAALRYPKRRELHQTREKYLNGTDFRKDSADFDEAKQDFFAFVNENTPPSKLGAGDRSEALTDALSSTISRTLRDRIAFAEASVKTYKDSLRFVANDWQDRKKMSQRFGKNDPDLFKAYENMFGEVEARDTAARLDLDAEGRYRTQPYSQAVDLPTGEVILARNSGSSASTRFMEEPYRKKSTSAEKMRTVNDVDASLGFVGARAAKYTDHDPQTWIETERKSEAFGFSPSAYLKRKDLSNLPEIIDNAAQILTNQMDDLAGLGARAMEEGMTPSLFATIAEKIATVEVVYARFDDDTRAIARALNVLKRVRESRASAKALSRFMEENQGGTLLKDPEAAQEFLGHIQAVHAVQGPAAAANAVRKAGKYHAEDYAGSVVFNFMLSQPWTWFLNAVGAPANFGSDFVSDGLAAIGGQASKIPGLSRTTDRVMGREMQARRQGLTAAFWNAPTWANIAHAWQTGQSTHAGLVGKTGTRGLPLSSNKDPLVRGLGLAVENPQRIMASIDEFWAGFFQMSNLYGEAAKKAGREGLEGENYAARFKDLIENPTEDILKSSHAITNRQLFRDHDAMSRIARTITDIQTPRFEQELQLVMKKNEEGKWQPTQKVVAEPTSPGWRAAKFGTRLAIPFVPTIDSIARTVIRNTPMGALAKALRSTGAERHAALGRLALATGLFATFASMAADGSITGAEDPDRAEQATVGAARPPMSIKMGDQWYSYRGYDPIAGQIAMAATATERYNKGQNVSEGLMGGITGFADALMNTTYAESVLQAVKGIQDVTNSVTEGKPLGPAATNFIAGQAANIATPGIVRWTNQEFNDPALRDTTSDGSVLGRGLDRARAGRPWASEDLPQRHDVFGRPQLNQRQDRMVETDPIILEAVRLEELSKQVLIGPVGRSIGSGDARKELNSREYQEYQKLAGEYLLSDLRDEMATEEWKTYSDEEKIEVIKEIKEIAREDARTDLFAEVETAE